MIGVDGADWGYLNYGLEKGKLPTIQKLMKEGTHGRLKAVIPPISLVSWLSFASGQNPGRIGHYGYIKKVENSYKTEIKFIGAYSRIKIFWQRLNKKKIKVGIVNLPYLYPPIKTDKFMVSFSETWRSKSWDALKGADTCFPKELGVEVVKKLGKLDYEVTYSYFDESADKRIEKSITYLKNRSKLNKFLLKKYGSEIDFFMTVFNPDRIHHFITDKEKTLKYYIELDKEIKSLIKNFKPDDTFMVSDHGEGPVKKEFYVNEFLMKNNLLKLKKKGSFLNTIGFNLENIQKVLSVFKLDSILIRILPRNIIENHIKKKIPSKNLRILDAEIDWKRTTAFSLDNSGGGIFLNVKGREPEGIVEKKDYEKTMEDIITRLKNLKDPETGKKLRVDAFKKSEVYHGEFIGEAPDVVYSIEDWDYIPKTALSGKVFKNPRDPGNHKQYGVFIASGKDIKSGEIKNAEFIDIAPTILKMYGIKKPEDMDGKILDIFK